MITAFLFLAVLMAIGVPVAYSMIAASLVYFVLNGDSIDILAQKMTASLASFPLLAIPLFILAGVFMSHGGIAKNIVDLADSFIGHFRGGLAQVAVYNSVLMGGMTGSSTADAAVDAKVLVPQMLRKGYPLGTAAALCTTSGAIVVLIPPSIGLIVYGLVAQVSVGKLFLAGVIPGILLAVGLSICVRILAQVGTLPATRSDPAPWRERGRTLRTAAPALLMPVLLILGLRAGVFTPTELGAATALYAFLVGFLIYRKISARKITSQLTEAASSTGVVLLIVAAASVFGFVMTVERVPQTISEALFSVSDNPIIVLLVINLALLALGAVSETLTLMILVAPILAPLAADLGVDPIHFGIIIVLNMSIGGITPPIGVVMFAILSITKCSMWEYTKGIWPLLVAILCVLGVVTYVPAVSLLLPDLLLK